MDDNQIIHEVMGLMWYSEDSMGFKQYEWKNGVNINPDYTSPEHYCRLMDWMREKEGTESRSYLFDLYCQNEAGCPDIEDWIDRTRQDQVSLIAEAIKKGVFK